MLSLGGNAAGFDLPKPPGSSRTRPRFAAGASNWQHQRDFADLPDQWIGYEGADLVVLNTGTTTDEL